MSPRPLAHFVDQLTAKPEVSVSESVGASITVNGIYAEDTVVLVGLLGSLSWPVSVVDDSGFEVSLTALDDGLEPYSISFQKPAFAQGIGFVATKAFVDWLVGGASAEGVVRVASSTVPFRTMGFVVCSWDEVLPSEVVPVLKSPRDLVRSIGAVNPLPFDLRPFLLHQAGNIPWGDVVFDAWIPAAFRAIAYSIAAEVEIDTLEFTGPPRLVLDVDEYWDASGLGSKGFGELQEAARWVYELDREAEVRHRLFIHEFARVAIRGQSVASAIASSCALALDGAKITYRYGLHEQSKDAIKSLSELRKAVVDETSKIAETSRQLALSTAGALFYALGLIAGKVVTPVSPWILDTMGLLGVLYLASIVATNARFLGQQRALRTVWRQKLYRYLTESEYTELVAAPIRSVEQSVVVMMWFVSVFGLVMFGAVLLNDHTPFLDAFLTE